MEATFAIKNLPKVNNHPLGENSQILVALVHNLTFFRPCHSAHFIKARMPDFSCNNLPKRENIPKKPKVYNVAIKYVDQIAAKYIDQMAIKFADIFHCQTLKNFPQLGI
jgi:hypothetical protein